MFGELTLIQAIVFYTLEAAVIVAVAIGGIFIGKKLRDIKTKK